MTVMGHEWDIIAHMKFTEFHAKLYFNVLNTLKKTHALGRSLVILKYPRHAVKVAGILFKACDPQTHPFWMRPLG